MLLYTLTARATLDLHLQGWACRKTGAYVAGALFWSDIISSATVLQFDITPICHAEIHVLCCTCTEYNYVISLEANNKYINMTQLINP